MTSFFVDQVNRKCLTFLLSRSLAQLNAAVSRGSKYYQRINVVLADQISIMSYFEVDVTLLDSIPNGHPNLLKSAQNEH